MSQLSDKISSVINTQINSQQQTLIAAISQGTTNNFMGQVAKDKFVYGSGSNTQFATDPSQTSDGSTTIAGLAGSRFLRPGDVGAVVGGRIF